MKQALEASDQEDLFNTSETSSFSDYEVDLTSEICLENYTEPSVFSLDHLDMGKKPFFKSGPPDENFTEAVSFVKSSFS